MTKYYYLLGYVRETRYGTQIFSNEITEFNQPILTAKDVKTVTEMLSEKNGGCRVILFRACW